MTHTGETTQDPTDPFTTRLLITPDAPHWQEAEELEYEVFRERQYVTSREEHEAEYAPYLSATRFIAVLDEAQLYGVARLILPSRHGFKTIRDAANNRLDISPEGLVVLRQSVLLKEVVEVATIAVPQRYQKWPSIQYFSNRLYCGVIDFLHNFTQQQEPQPERHLVLASFDSRYLGVFQHTFRDITVELGNARDYIGSPTIPVLIDCDKMEQADEQRDADRRRLKWLGRLVIS